MDPSNVDTSMLPGAIAARAHRFVRGFVATYGGFALLGALLLALVLVPGTGMARARLLLRDALHGGLAALVLNALLLALMTLLAALLMTAARQYSVDGSVREGRRPPEGPEQENAEDGRRLPSLSLAQFGPAVMARQGQAIVLTSGAVLIWVLTILLFRALSFQPLSPDGNLAAGFAIVIAFPSLIAERMVAGYPVSQLPEGPSLRRMLLFVTVLLGLAGLMEIGRGVGLAWLVWPIRLLIWLPALVAAELALRALARFFVPAPPEHEMRAGTESLLLTLLTAGPRAPGALLREHLGLDFTRSWALSYLKSAALPAVAITAVFCWCLSGLKLVAYDQRGVYERLGAPVGVLGPGLHLLLPWPLGHLRPVEYGTVHTIVAGINRPLAAIEPISAEATAPASMNRIWETINPTEVEYLVASQSNNQQGFQAVSAEIRVLYRTGLTDADALQSVYGAADQSALVKAAASRLATSYFASHTLDDVMGARRDTLEDTMRRALARDLTAEKAGIEVVAVVIEAIHPPAGAAQAYHAVQAAQINADASIFDETARAEHTRGTAQQEATQALDAAQAGAAELLARANAGAYRFAADVRSNALGPTPFLMERRFDNLAGLAGRQLIVMDSRLNPAQAPLIDMRAPVPGRPGIAAASTPTVSSLTATPGTSTEGVAPPMTSEQAGEEARQAQRGGVPDSDDIPPNLR